MDFLLIIVLMAVLYLVPEFLRRQRQPRRYEYPEIPLPAPKPRPARQEAFAETPLAAVSLTPPPVHEAEFVMPPPVRSAKPQEEASPWQGKFDATAMMNGIIFAEILLPPRAYRPFVTSSNTGCRPTNKNASRL